MNESTTTQSELSTLESAKEADNSSYYKVEDIGETIFKKATSDEKKVYLLGLDIIAQATDEKREKQIEKTLKALDTQTLIPIIASITKLIIAENQQNQNK